MSWDDFAVQIEDPQPGVFQLGYVNLPTAEIPGVEAELTFVVNDAWQIDATLGYNDAQVSEATDAHADRRRRRRLRAGSRGWRAPAAHARLERRARHRVAPARAAPERAAVRAASTSPTSARWSPTSRDSSRWSARPASARRMPTRRRTSASGSRARRWSGSFFVENLVGRAGRDVPEQPLGGAAPVDHPAAHLRAAVPLRLLTRRWTSACRSATSARSTWRRSAPPSSRRTRRPGTRTSSGRRTTRSTSRRARSCSCSRTSTTGRRSRWRNSRAGTGCPRSPCRSCTTSSAGSTRRAAPSSAPWRRSCSRAGASCRTAIRTRPSASAIASTCRSSPTRACAS